MFKTISHLNSKKIAAALVMLTLGLSFVIGYAFNFQRFEQLMSSRFGADRVQILRSWQSMLYHAQNISTIEKVRKVNDFFNQNLYYQIDQVVWGQLDYWASPLESMGMGRGDCEDYAIEKYYALQLLGVSVENLRMVYVKIARDTPSGRILQAHMVLAYYPTPNAMPFILDNFNTQLLPASQRPDLFPIYNFNSKGVWQGTGRKAVRGRMSRWQALLAKVQEEGF